jgi:hypothetical protein
MVHNLDIFQCYWLMMMPTLRMYAARKLQQCCAAAAAVLRKSPCFF